MNLRDETQFCDITLISQEGESFPAHKLILRVTSSYLKTKIQQRSDAQSTIVLKTINSEILSALLDFIYKGKAIISEAETESFIDAAKKWKIQQFLRLKKKKKAAVKTSQPGETINPQIIQKS